MWEFNPKALHKHVPVAEKRLKGSCGKENTSVIVVLKSVETIIPR